MIKYLKIIFLFAIILTLSIISTCDDDNSTGSDETIYFANIYGVVTSDNSDINETIDGAIVNIGFQFDTTSNGGQYSFQSITAKTHPFLCIHPDFDTISGSIDIDSGSIEFNITMIRPTSNFLIGKVVNKFDDPMANAIVNIGDKSDTTNLSGEYVFYNVADGNITLECDYEGFSYFIDTINIIDDTTYFDILLHPDRILSGTVTNIANDFITNAIITIDGNTDTTDDSGRYVFKDIPYGNYNVLCTQSDYLNYSSTINIDTDTIVYDIEMENLPISIDTLWIEEDAYVCYYSSEFGGNECDDNHGSSGGLLFGYSHWSESYYDPMIGYYTVYYQSSNRILFKKPQIDLGQIDSLHFRLVPSNNPVYDLCCMRVSFIAEDWFEDSVTWSTQPGVSDGYFDINYPITNDTSTWTIDITDHIDEYVSSYGLMFRYYKEFERYIEAYQFFYSSENETAANRPCVIVYY